MFVKILLKFIENDVTGNGVWDVLPGSVILCPVLFAHYTVSGKKGPEYFSHNFDKFRHSFVIFGTNHPDTSVY